MRYSSIVDGLGASGTDAWRVHFTAAQRRAAGQPVIMLSVGDPDFDTPQGITDAAIGALRAGHTKYSNAGGIPVLIDAIAAEESARLGTTVDRRNVVVTQGAQNALYVTMRCLLNPGDEVILLAPPYVMFDGVARACAAKPVAVPLDMTNGFALDVERVREAVTEKTRAILLNSPHNPSGAVAKPEAVRALLELCIEKDLWLVSDEVYIDLVFDGAGVSPCQFPGGPDRTVILRSFSKSHAMSGWRLGWLIGPAELATHARNLMGSIQYGGAAFLQIAAAHALSAEKDAAHGMKQAYRARRDLLVDRFACSPRLSLETPKAGMFCLLDISATGLNSQLFAEGLLDREGVSVLPGRAFGPMLDGHVRIALCQPEAVLADAADRIIRFAENPA